LLPGEQYQIRKSVIRRLLKKGMKANEVAAALDVSRSLVYATKKAFDEAGIEAIRHRKRGHKNGEKRTLTPEQESEIMRSIVGKSPEQLKLKCCLWTCKVIRDTSCGSTKSTCRSSFSECTCAGGA
jgi:transposase